MKSHSIGKALLALTALTACSPRSIPTAAPIASLTFPAIAFHSNRSGDNEIYVMNADGSGQTNLTQNPANDVHPVWSPDHTRLAFSTDRDGNAEIYVMNADGSNPINLTHNPALDDYPVWSSDGMRILFDTYLDENLLYVMNSDGSNLINLTTDERIYFVGAGHSWSPDGQRIAFSSNALTNSPRIYVMNADGGGVTAPSARAEYLSWSPDGTQIAFGGVDGDIYVMDADGGNQINLTNNAADDDEPSWSPDGTQIAFNSDRDGNREIYVMNADGTGQTNLSNSSGYDYSPAWSTR